MAIFLLACKEMTTRIKKLLIYMVSLHFKVHQLLLPMLAFQWNLIVSNNTLAFSIGLLSLFYYSLYRGMHIKANIVAEVFLVRYFVLAQYFRNTTIVAYAGFEIW